MTVLLELTDRKSGAKILVNTDNVDLIIDGGKSASIAFNGNKGLYPVKESYKEIKALLDRK